MTESQDNTINANLTPLPDKVGVDGLEDKWREVWDESEVYKFQGTRDRKAVYSIDTPPPTVSGHLHVGHVFSYTHTDVIARFKRMNGYDVFYPMGWDDNGLPTERRVQNYYGVRVDTSLKYDPDFVPPFEGTDGKKIDAKDQVPISRKNFIELCEKLTAQDEKQFEALWRSSLSALLVSSVLTVLSGRSMWISRRSGASAAAICSPHSMRMMVLSLGSSSSSSSPRDSSSSSSRSMAFWPGA